MNNCIFCNIEENLIIHEYNHFNIIRDAFPVTPLHSLIITKRHVVSYFQCSQEEHDEIPIVLDTLKTEFQILDEAITGFNIGMNSRKGCRANYFSLSYSYYSKEAR